MITKIYQTIKSYDHIIIHRHARPDGDALGSQLGLKRALELTYPNKKIYAVGDYTDRYMWIGEMDEIDDSVYEGALVIILDTGAEYMISDDRYKLAKEIIKIDHHIPQGTYGDLVYVDTSYESCAGIIADFCFEKRYKMDKQVASYLLTGIITDSGRFRYNSTNSNTFKVASKLMDYDIDTEYIYNKLYSEKLSVVKLKAKMTEKYEIYDNVAILINKYEDIIALGSTCIEVSRGMIGLMSGVNEIDCWASFTYDNNGDIYVEIRSNKFNINQVATKYGGGGHIQASGATIKDESLIPLIIEDIKKVAKGEMLC